MSIADLTRAWVTAGREQKQQQRMRSEASKRIESAEAEVARQQEILRDLASRYGWEHPETQAQIVKIRAMGQRS